MTDKKQLYSDLYQQGEQVLRKHNPCKVTNGRCLSGSKAESFASSSKEERSE
jgi:hypothetical protein